MSSIILPVGQCGNQIGHELMTLIENYSVSHPLSHRDGKIRCVCVDSEPKVIRSYLKSDKKQGQFLREENMIVGQSGRGNNFALGYHGLGGETEETSLMNRTMEAIRKEVERSDYFAGTIVMHSLTGGTGSGLGSRLVEALRDAYPLAHVISVAVSPHISGDSPLQHYNSLLSLAALQRSADCVVVFSNDDVLRHLVAYRGIAARQQPSGTSVSLKDMNQLIAASIAGVFLPLGEKPPKISGKNPTGQTEMENSSKSSTITSATSLDNSRTHAKSKFSEKRPHTLLYRSGRSILSPSSTKFDISGVSEISSFGEDDSSSAMQRQPRATVSALMRYRGITECTSKSDALGSILSQSSSSSFTGVTLSDDVTKGNEPWEMLRSICPEPSKKFASIHHMAKPKVTWEALTQSLLHSMCRYDKDGHQFSTLGSLLIARGAGEKPFADSSTKIEERLKSSLGCVEWNPFPLDFWIGQYSAAGCRDAQSLTLCLNSSRIMGFLGDVMSKAKTMYDAGAYVHWFEKHGCTKDDFLDAFATLDCVVEEYRYSTS